MTPPLSTDEQRYLRAAFTDAPNEWFRPRTVASRDFSDREIDKIVESLARHGLMNAEPDRHARLTDQGRKEAAQLDKLAKRDWRKFDQRRRARITIASAVVGVCVLLFLLRITGVL